MPIYVYICDKCDKQVEVIKAISDAEIVPECELCGKKTRRDWSANSVAVKFNCDMSHTASNGKPVLTTPRPSPSNYGYGEQIEKAKEAKSKDQDRRRKKK